MSKFELPKTQFVGTVRDKIACKTHLESENDCYTHIFGFHTQSSLNFLFDSTKNTPKFGIIREKSGVKI